MPIGGKASLHEVAAKYKLPDFVTAIFNYFNSPPGGSFHWKEVSEIPFTCIDVWDHVRIQLRTVQDDNILTAPQTVMAAPPSETLPFGYCNFVLFIERAGEPSYVGISKMLKLAL